MAKKILVVDDDKLILGTLKRLLKKEGYNPTVAENSREALKKVKGEDFDLILTDIKMPGNDGIETLQQIRKYLSEAGKNFIPELIITGYNSDENRKRVDELKVAGYIIKPFDLEELLSNIEKHLKNNDTRKKQISKAKLPDLMIGDIVINPPIIQGGMGVRVSRAPLVSAVSNVGGLGVIASVGLFKENITEKEYETCSSEALRSEIRKTKELTSRPFAVNIMYALTNYDPLVKITIEEKVAAIITGAGLPLHLPTLTENSPIKLIPIVSSRRAADIIIRAWIKRYKRLPDAFVVEGPLAGGHLGFSYSEAMGINQINLENILKDVLDLVKAYENTHSKKIPIIAAGGIFTGADIAKMLKSGASGVQMATRFVCTKECDVADKYKETYIKCRQKDITIILSPAGMPLRVIRNKFVERIQAGEKMKFKCPYKCLKTCDPYSANYCIADALVQSSSGNFEEGFAVCGANAWRVNKVVKVKELITELAEEAIKELEKSG